MICTVSGCVSGPTVLMCFLICHAQLSRPSLTLQTTRTAPPPASKLHPNTSKFAKEEKLSEFAEGLVAENTNKSTKWALKNFEKLVDFTETELQSFFSEFSGDYM